MKKYIGQILLFSIFPFCLKAQYYSGYSPADGKLTEKKPAANQWVDKGDIHLRWYPLGLLNFYDLNLTVGGEYSYAANKSIILDAGYIMASILGNESGDLKPATGYIVKTSHRWYYGKRYNESFLDAEATFKSSRYQSGDQWVGRGVVDGVPAYEELMSVTSRKDVFTAGARMGKRTNFSQNSPLGLEFWWGLGVRYRHYYPDLPDDSQVTMPFAWFFNPFNYDESWLPDLQMGVRLTFRAQVRKAKN